VAGTLLADVDDVRTGGRDLPATLGMPRPALARLLVERAVAFGAKVRFGTTVSELASDEDGVSVVFSDGGRGWYDVVLAELLGRRHRTERPTVGGFRATTDRPGHRGDEQLAHPGGVAARSRPRQRFGADGPGGGRCQRARVTSAARTPPIGGVL
jgi:hypothetical protein